MSVSVADEVWIGTALLHHEHPEREDFAKQEILERIRQEHIVTPERPGVSMHISSHAVADKKPQPGTYRMLVDTGRGRRRLFREGDVAHEGRTGKTVPRPEDVPSRYHRLLNWYEEWSQRRSKRKEPPRKDSLSLLAGVAKGIWGEDPVRYIRRLRGYE